MELCARACFAIVLLGCGSESHAPGGASSEGDEQDAAAVAPPFPIEGCGDDLRDDLRDAAACNSDQRCADVAMNPDQPGRFELEIREEDRDENGNAVPVPETTRDHRLRCLVSYADALGVRAYLPSPGGVRVGVEGSFAEVEPLLRPDIVFRYKVICPFLLGNCDDHCASLDEDGCAADPFCRAIRGARYGDDNVCTDGLFAGCAWGDRLCGASWVFATAPDGACWDFGSTCIPDGFLPLDSSMCDPEGGIACGKY